MNDRVTETGHFHFCDKSWVKCLEPKRPSPCKIYSVVMGWKRHCTVCVMVVLRREPGKVFQLLNGFLLHIHSHSLSSAPRRSLQGELEKV